MRVAIACGGTGGHLFPGVAVAQELQRRGHETLLLVSQKQIDAVALQGRSNLSARSLSGIGWPGLSARLPVFFGKLFSSWKECRAIYREFQPSAVLGMGGFTSAVPLLMGRRMHLPTFIHESNAFPGRVTRLIAKRVDKVLLGFERCGDYLENSPWVVTGTPVRQDLTRIDRAAAAEKFGLNPDFKTILIMGGSQGAHGINQAVLRAIPMWQDKRERWQMIHLTGPSDAKIVEINYRRARLTAMVEPFSSEMAAIYSLADVAISRSGAASLTELGAYGIPSILIPYPAAADDHQTRNAELFEAANAARMIPESRLSPEGLNAAVTEIVENPEVHQRMNAAMLNMSTPHASERVAEEIEKCSLK